MKRIAALIALAGIVSIALAADWPQYMGPNRDNTSPETKLADKWPDGGPKVLWQYDKLSKGIGGAVIRDGKVYVMDRVKDEQDVVVCLDLAKGTKEWEFAFDAPGKWSGGYGGARNLPAVDDKHIFVIGAMGHLHCIDLKEHKSVWSVDLVKTYESTVSNWGFCQSPVLHKDTVIVAPLGKTAGVVAFDKATGKEAWKTPKLGGIAWTSPMIAKIGDVEQVLVLHTRDQPRLNGVDAASGKVLWEYKGWKCANPIPSPMSIGDGRIFLAGGYNAGCAMVKVTRDGDKWEVAELFQNKNLGTKAVNPVLFEKHIYANSADNKNGLMCMDLDGNVKWKTEEKNLEELGSVIIADGKIYNLLSEKATLRMAKATPDEFKELDTATVMEGKNNWAPAAMADGKLIVRYRNVVKCLEIK